MFSGVGFAAAHLAALDQGITISFRCAPACRGVASITIPASAAHRLHLGQRTVNLARGRFSGQAGRLNRVHFAVSHSLAAKLGKLESLRVTVTLTAAGAVTSTSTLTLKR